jgi:hypothetical protein
MSTTTPGLRLRKQERGPKGPSLLRCALSAVAGRHDKYKNLAAGSI